MIQWIVFPTNDGAGGDLWDEHLADVGGKSRAVHCALDDPWRDQGILRQARDQGLRSPTSEGRVHRQAFTPFRPPSQAGEVRLHRGFVNEDNPVWHPRDGGQAMFEPIAAQLSYLGATTLARDQ